MIDFEITDEQRLIRETAREFSDKEIAPRARENDRNEHFDTELVQKMADMGFLGAIVPEEYGGRGVDYLTYGLIVEEIGRNDSAMRTVVSVVTSLVCSSIVRWGSEEQKQRWLPEALLRRGLGCFGLTEPDTGSDASNLKTRAKKIDGGWRINGGKMWISIGNFAKLAMIFAQTDPSKKHNGLPASSSRPTPTASPHRRSTASSASRDPTPPSSSSTASRSPTTRSWARSATASRSRCRRSTRAATASPPAASGSARASLNASVAYSKERKQFDRPIASFQLVQEMIADMVVQTEAARGLVWRAGWLKDQGKPNTTETSIAKLYATEAAVECANKAIQVHGGSGYVDDYPVERYLRDARVTTLYEGTSQIQKLIIGRAVTGENALVP